MTGKTFPAYDFIIIAENTFAALDLDLAVAEGEDALNYKDRITLSDGRTFTTTKSGESINSDLFYHYAFGFSSKFACLFSTPPPGDYIIDMIETYGDRWNGNFIKITVDGQEALFTINDSTDTSRSITIPSGLESATWDFLLGVYPKRS
ncbi:hypothetical protein Celal_0631 [Cellulophaga algicola DSM 14237]|uniref:Uncharacterized protein n=1 Tax=Cellulophaga algicola (strain DSM 14237 / IC166 / ACAM 630) TaxID=688270 RepID=E6XCJ5_CELAD|nr:hypothetical protein [Cellulophaga algicola]ADV47970.1 hypothetical protein Celal_0631 [Cellulophaga algicola DSM 14237]